MLQPSDLYDEDETGSDDSTGLDQQARETEYPSEEACKDVKALKHEAEQLAADRDMEKEDYSNAVALKELVVRGMIKRKAWDVVHNCRIAGTTDERCRMALSHIRKVCF